MEGDCGTRNLLKEGEIQKSKKLTAPKYPEVGSGCCGLTGDGETRDEIGFSLQKGSSSQELGALEEEVDFAGSDKIAKEPGARGIEGCYF